MRPKRLRREDAVLAVIDVQERLLPVIHRGEELTSNIARLVRGTHVLGVPALVTEQYVKGLGPSVERLREVLKETHGYDPIEKMSFSSAGCEAFSARLKATGRKKVILAGVEAHVCVYQTALDLMTEGLEVYLVADAISSRTAENKDIAIRRLLQEGVKLTSTEMVLLEMTRSSGTDEFRAISRLIK